MHDAIRRLTVAAAILVPVTVCAGERPLETAILIQPFNYDPADPWAYSRQAGRLSPGGNAGALIWNRPIVGGLVPVGKSKPAEPALEPPIATPGGSHAGRQSLGTDGTAAEIVQLGYSVKGVPIVMHVYGRGNPATLVFGGIHGDEANSAELARQLIEHLDVHPLAIDERCVAVLPAANPDGLSRGIRTNTNDVDVNRNFPALNWTASKPGRYYGGAEQASEPETQALIEAVELLDPACIVSIHCISRGRHGNNYDGPAEALAAAMAAQNGYRVLKSIGYPTPGSFGSWAGVDRQIPTITLELPHDLHGPRCWEENGAALLEVIRMAGDETGK